MYVYVCVSLCVCHMCVSIHRVQKTVFHSLEFKAVVSHLTWIQGDNLEFSRRGGNSLKH